MRQFFILFLLVFLSACTIGNGHICGPQTPLFYCDKDAYEQLIHPKPAISYWVKNGTDETERKLDSKLCNAVHNPPEMNYPAWEKCMLGKGYKYTGECKSEVMKKRPACGAL